MKNKELFIGRASELQSLKLLEKKFTASFVVIRGRRRIGKSRLVNQFALESSAQRKLITFTGLAPEPGVTEKHQREMFADRLFEHFGLRGLNTDNWSDLFFHLIRETGKGKFIIFLDEISWMAHKDPTFLAKLKTSWDEGLSQNPNLILIVCGSISVWVEKNILSATAFVGRVSLEILLEELSLSESNQLLTALQFSGSAYERFQILAVTGGVPWYLQQIISGDTAFSFISRSCFTKSGFLVKEFEKIFHDLFNKRSVIYRKVIEVLVDQPMEYQDLCEKLEYRTSGRLSEYLNNLVLSGFIRRDYAWQVGKGESTKLSRYRLSDNYIRFYLKYIAKNKNKIEAGKMAVTSMSAFPAWETLMGFQFENLILNNRKMLLEFLNLPPEDIVLDNVFFQRETQAQLACQIDYLIETKYKTLYVCEVKFSRDPVGVGVIAEVEEKIRRLAKTKNTVCIPVLIYVNGVSESLIEKDYFRYLINMQEVLK